MSIWLPTSRRLILACLLVLGVSSSAIAEDASDQQEVAIKTEDGRLWMSVKGERLEDVLSAIAAETGIELKTYGDLTRTVTFSSDGEPLEVVLRSLTESETTVMEYDSASVGDDAPRLARLTVYASHGERDTQGLSTNLDRISRLRERLMDDDEVDLKPNAVHELAEIGDQEATGVLLEAMPHQSTEVRTQIIDAFVRIGGTQGPKALEESLSSEIDPSLRHQMLEGLEFLGTAEAVDALEAARKSSHEDVRSGAESALEDLGL